ncbi:MAG: hypothetical protein QXD03_01870 [Candidatus Anstonellales archaeon]
MIFSQHLEEYDMPDFPDSPEKFIEFYWNEMKDYLNSRNIQLSKSGFVGYMLHILGFLQYDIKQYYDFLLRESLPSTATTPQSLYFHSVIYGYVPPLASPSSLVGEFELNLSLLPNYTADIASRDIYFNSVSFKIGELEYNLFSRYRLITTDNRNYNVEIFTHDGNFYSTGFSSTLPRIPIFSLLQMSVYSTEMRLPFYQFGSYYYYPISMKNNQVCNCEVYIDDVKFDIEFIRSISTGDDNVVFVRYLYDNLIIEFGSGYHGKYVAGSRAKVNIYVTKGVLGNIGKGSYFPSGGIINIVDNLLNGSTRTYSISASNFINARILYGTGGKDILSPDDLRMGLIKYIRTRENLVTERDYRDLFENVSPDFEVMFRKIDVRDNHIYNYIVIYDKYMVPYDTTTYSPLKSELVKDETINGKDYYIFPEFVVSENKSYISPFMYEYDPILRSFKAFIFFDKIDSYFNKVEKTVEYAVIPPLSFRCEYNNGKLTIYVKSYQNILDYIFYISSPQLGIDRDRLSIYDENTHYIDIPFFYNGVDFFFDVEHRGSVIARMEVNNVSIAIDISDYLSTKEYIPTYIDIKQTIEINGNEYISYREPDDNEIVVVSFPVIERSQFLNDKDYIVSKIFTIISSSMFPGKRMISDTIMFNFFNTSDIKNTSLIVKSETMPMDIKLPLNMEVKVYIDKDDVPKYYNVNFNEEIKNLRLELASILKTKYTGKFIKFHKTKIIDYIHNREWIKKVELYVRDSNGVIVPDFESIDSMSVLKRMDKDSAVKFVPVYWWWDLNNIKVDLFIL